MVFSGRRFDTGDKLSYLKANVILAAERPEFGDDLRAWLKDFCRRELLITLHPLSKEGNR